MPKTTTVNPVPGAEGAVAVGHSDEVTAHYRQVTEAARRAQQSGMAPPGAVQSAQAPAPGEAPLPMIGVARHYQAKELASLRGKAEGAERWLNSSQIGMGGLPVPGLATQRVSAMGELEAIREAIGRLESMDDQAVREWAGQRGVR